MNAIYKSRSIEHYLVIQPVELKNSISKKRFNQDSASVMTNTLVVKSQTTLKNQLKTHNHLLKIHLKYSIPSK